MNFINLREPVSAWSHVSWLLLSIPGTWLLWQRSRGDLSRQVSFFIYGLSLSFCFGSSALFHGAYGSASEIEGYNRLDHIAIYVLIAGSYTPIAWNMMKGRQLVSVLAVTWSMAAAGALRISVYGLLPPVLSTTFYLAMGWGALFCYFELARILSHRALLPLLLGGVLYSVGAIFNILHWPVFWPGVFEYHELFHVLVMAGSLAHFWFMLAVVIPFVVKSHEPLVKSSLTATRPTPHFTVLPSRIANWRVHFLWVSLPSREPRVRKNRRVPPSW